MIPAGGPPVVGEIAGQIRNWIDELVTVAAGKLTEGDPDERERFQAQLAVARFLELHARDLQKRMADKAQELGATNEAIAYWGGVRASTAMTKFPNRHRRGLGQPGTAGFSGWRKRS